MFYDIEKHYREEIDYRIRIKDSGGRILILAPHGGGIERGTSELAEAIAGDDFSFYIFEAILPKASQSQKLHITSTRFNEPKCLELINKFPTSVAIHGCTGPKPMIYVGGRDENLKKLIVEGLQNKGYPALYGTGRYAGSFQSNICNRTSMKKGVQLELSNGLRRLLFNHWQTRKGRRAKTVEFDKLVRAIRETFGRKIYGNI